MNTNNFNLVRQRMLLTKQAGLGSGLKWLFGGLGKGLGGLSKGLGKVINPLVTRPMLMRDAAGKALQGQYIKDPAGAILREASPARIIGSTLGGAYGGARLFGAPGFSSPEEGYKQNMRSYEKGTEPTMDAIQYAQSGGHLDLAQKLLERQAKGNFDASDLPQRGFWRKRFGTPTAEEEIGERLNAAQGNAGTYPSWGIRKAIWPWGASEGAQGHLDIANQQKGILQTKLRKAIDAENPEAFHSKIENMRTNMQRMPKQYQSVYQRQIDLLNDKLRDMPPTGMGTKAQEIRQKMIGAGIPESEINTDMPEKFTRPQGMLPSWATGRGIREGMQVPFANRAPATFEELQRKNQLLEHERILEEKRRQGERSYNPLGVWGRSGD